MYHPVSFLVRQLHVLGEKLRHGRHYSGWNHTRSLPIIIIISQGI
jgi:hypothetical protein